MSVATAIALVLALGVSVGALRWLLRWRRLPAASRPAPWRRGALLALQLAGAALLYFTLLPPERAVPGTTLVVMTAGADVPETDALADEGILVALPEAGRDASRRAGADSMPDLATALRAHPGALRLRVLGQGLEARDLAAAEGLAIDFEPPPLPRGFVALRLPGSVVAGGLLRVGGRVHAVEGGRVELLDPAGAVQDRAAPDADGRFLLQGAVRAAGPAHWRLRLVEPAPADGARGRDDAGNARADGGDDADRRGGDAGRGNGDSDRALALVEVIDLPVDAGPGSRPRLLLLAGAPGPELKYLRRWAADAGLDLHSRMALGGGAVLGDGPVAFDAATLSGFDLVILDERAWTGLDAGARQALLAAVEAGLGLMLRITAPPDAATHRALRELGFGLGEHDEELAAEVRLADGIAEAEPVGAGGTETADGADPAHADPQPRLPTLVRQPRRLTAPGSVPLLQDASGAPLARWRAAGRGRIAAWNLDHSFRLVLTGHADRHVRLWSEAVATLARARAAPTPRLVGLARQGHRAVLCDLPEGATLVAGDGVRLHPLPDPAAGGCAAVWPLRAGWHRIESGAGAAGVERVDAGRGAGDDGREDGNASAATHVHVLDPGVLPGLDAAARRDATLRLQATGGDRPAAAASAPAPPAPAATHPGPRWPWFLAWLAATGLLWWLERTARPATQRGRIAAAPP